MKIFAFYLPQYHTIPENDAWWGKGFTEWTNVKKATPLYHKHNQPRVPLNKNYYDLSNHKTLEWQADLLKEYKIDGLCFYHYWFKNKKLLEKPAEILLNNRKIDMPFFFSWANEPWTRSWDGLNSNILIDQDYGDEQDWITHFNYLKPFFKDPRYVKHNGYPIFVLYRSANFKLCKDWIKCWRKLAQECGLGDIHFVSSLTSFEKDPRELGFNASLYFEPMNTTSHHLLPYKQSKSEKFAKKISTMVNRLHGFKDKLDHFDYDHTWQSILNKKTNEEVYAGAFIAWDNTPRKQAKGSISIGANPIKFEQYFSLLYKQAKENNTPYIFINAWNEWAEGAYLEPDTKYQYQHLNAIRNTVIKSNLQ
ncbi:MAG: glycoside hydrolase family 99-like domain-containing protein [Negativicutes bacterium]|mgnify:CR=1 FL=1|jgi:hypothetical protein|nr:glycoside hydrolase family 99-like domain-containing protein [Negativicutes bacterium]